MRWRLLDVLDDGEQRAVLMKARRRRFARNEVIFHEGDPGDVMHLVDRGHVGLRLNTPLGDVAMVRVVGPGQFFGELAVIRPGPRNATAVCLEKVETLAIGGETLAELRMDHPEIDRLLLEALVQEVRRLASQLVEATYMPVDRRVWRRLLALTQVYGEGDVPSSSIPLTQDTVAELVGCTRSTVNQVLRRGVDAGIISLDRGRVGVLDHAALTRLSN